MSTVASAANWEFAPLVEAGWRVSDNYRLGLPGSEIEVSGAEADAALTWRTVDPRLTVELTPRVRATRFPGDEDEDSTDYFFSGKIGDSTPRRDVGASADYSREDVVHSELPEPGSGGDLGDPGGGDSGRALERNRRELIRLAPYFTYRLTERHGIEADARYVDANFEEQSDGELQDFSEIGASVGWRNRYSERTSLVLRGVVSQYETNFSTDAYGADVQWDRQFTETSRMYLRLGGRQTKPERGEDDTNLVAGIGGRWDSQRNALFLDLTRSIEPISAGTVVERYQARMRLMHDVSQRFALTVGLRATHDEDIEESSTYPTRKFASGEVGFEWRLARAFSLTGSYNRVWQDYADEPDSRNSNGFLISLVYEPKRTD